MALAQNFRKVLLLHIQQALATLGIKQVYPVVHRPRECRFCRPAQCTVRQKSLLTVILRQRTTVDLLKIIWLYNWLFCHQDRHIVGLFLFLNLLIQRLVDLKAGRIIIYTHRD